MGWGARKLYVRTRSRKIPDSNKYYATSDFHVAVKKEMYRARRICLLHDVSWASECEVNIMSNNKSSGYFYSLFFCD